MDHTATTEVRLTSYSHGAGCGCKLASRELRTALAAMARPWPTSDDVLVGVGTSDDAGVYRIAPDLALVQTLDFFTPVVDDPGSWGAIAAANALSDVYAMGGRPATALNIVAWPRQLPWELLAAVLDGAAGVLATAGCALVGGHSVDDPEPKFGLSVTGLVDPARMLTNAGGHPGDLLVLTKPLGTGVATTAAKRGVGGARAEAALAEAVATMGRLNAAAGEVAVAAGVRGATDVTGFGLVGHLSELVAASGVGAEVRAADLPTLAGVAELVAEGAVAGGTERNLADTDHVDWGEATPVQRVVACDAQTSGGLLLAVPPDRLDDVVGGLARRGEPAWVVGALTGPPAPGSPTVVVR